MAELLVEAPRFNRFDVKPIQSIQGRFGRWLKKPRWFFSKLTDKIADFVFSDPEQEWPQRLTDTPKFTFTTLPYLKTLAPDRVNFPPPATNTKRREINEALERLQQRVAEVNEYSDKSGFQVYSNRVLVERVVGFDNRFHQHLTPFQIRTVAEIGLSPIKNKADREDLLSFLAGTKDQRAGPYLQKRALAALNQTAPYFEQPLKTAESLPVLGKPLMEIRKAVEKAKKPFSLEKAVLTEARAERREKYGKGIKTRWYDLTDKDILQALQNLANKHKLWDLPKGDLAAGPLAAKFLKKNQTSFDKLGLDWLTKVSTQTALEELLFKRKRSIAASPSHVRYLRIKKLFKEGFLGTRHLTEGVVDNNKLADSYFIENPRLVKIISGTDVAKTHKRLLKEVVHKERIIALLERCKLTRDRYKIRTEGSNSKDVPVEVPEIDRAGRELATEGLRYAWLINSFSSYAQRLELQPEDGSFKIVAIDTSLLKIDDLIAPLVYGQVDGKVYSASWHPNGYKKDSNLIDLKFTPVRAVAYPNRVRV